MSETPFFFERDAARLFGFLHEPDGAASSTAFIMSHPFGEEKLWSHRVFVSFARLLAARGFPVLRFDYQGAGDSSGDASDTTLSSYIEDVGRAAGVFAARRPSLKRIGIIGLRLGATIAALALERSDEKRFRDAPLILWDPILDGDKYFQELLRVNLGTQLAVYGAVRDTRETLQARIRTGGRVNVDGYEIGGRLFESCAKRDLLTTSDKRHAGRVLVLQLAGRDKQKDRDDLRQLAGSYPRGSFARAVEQPFWREIKPFYARALNLQETTLSWLEAEDV